MPAASVQQKSYCKIKDHHTHEIVFACYECKDTYCLSCLDSHSTHTLIYFKDSYIVQNYDNVKLAVTAPKAADALLNNDPKSSPLKVANIGIGFDVYHVTDRQTHEKVVIKVFKNLKLRPEEHKTSIFNQI